MVAEFLNRLPAHAFTDRDLALLGLCYRTLDPQYGKAPVDVEAALEAYRRLSLIHISSQGNHDSPMGKAAAPAIMPEPRLLRFPPLSGRPPGAGPPCP